MLEFKAGSKSSLSPSIIANIGQLNGILDAYNNLLNFKCFIGERRYKQFKQVEFANLQVLQESFCEEELLTACLHERIDIFCTIFGRFRNELEDNIITANFKKLVFKLRNDQLYHFENENVRNVNFSSNLQNIFKSLGMNYHHIVNCPIASKSKGQIKCDMVVSSFSKEELEQGEIPELIVEFKNEIGCTTSEPIIEATSYYLYFVNNYLEKNNNIPSQNPTFILVVNGRSIFLYGAITVLQLPVGSSNGRYIIDLIDSIHLDQVIYNNSTVISRFFWKLLHSVESLKINRPSINSNKNYLYMPQAILDQPGVMEGGKLDQVKGKLVYLNSTKVFKIITGKYPLKIHKYAADMNIAPRCNLHSINENLHILNMDLIEGKLLEELFEFSDNYQYKDDWKRFVDNFFVFSKTFVHGDARASNIMFGNIPTSSNKEQFYFIDFDWSNYKDKAFYPHNINFKDIKWPEGVEAGGLITTEHDIEWLKKHTELLFPGDSDFLNSIFARDNEEILS